MNAMPKMKMPEMMGEMSSMNTMPMMSAMSPMMCHMTCAMTEGGMECMMTPAEGMSMDMMRDCCDMMQKMMDCGMPCMMTCNGMPMMMCCGMPMMPAMTCEMTAGGMRCMMKPQGAVSMDMMAMCCDMMNRMMGCGMTMTMMCGNVALMTCMH